MIESHPQPPPDNADKLSRHTTPTWEVELLISGAAVFAMLQFPGWLDQRMLAIMPRFANNLSDLLLVIYLYARGAAVILAMTFALHLILRAHWIAVVGMHSVFPDGVRWEKLRMGPAQKKVMERIDTSAAGSIERADNRSTVVFAAGISIGTLLVLLGVLACVVLLISLVVGSLASVQIDAAKVFTLFFCIVFTPLILAIVVDYATRKHLRDDSVVRRVLVVIFFIYLRVGMVRGYSTGNILASRGGQWRYNALMFAIIAPVFALIMVNMAFLKTPQKLGSYALFPHLGSDSPNHVVAANYDDQRDPLHDALVPFVDHAVATGAYLKLVVPYQPTRDAAALRHTCPAAPAMAPGDARARALLDCLAKLHPVTLDGKPLAALHYDAGSDADTRRPALQAMIDLRALAPGRHQLRVARAPLAPGEKSGRNRAKAYTITFWH